MSGTSRRAGGGGGSVDGGGHKFLRVLHARAGEPQLVLYKFVPATLPLLPDFLRAMRATCYCTTDPELVARGVQAVVEPGTLLLLCDELAALYQTFPGFLRPLLQELPHHVTVRCAELEGLEHTLLGGQTLPADPKFMVWAQPMLVVSSASPNQGGQ